MDNLIKKFNALTTEWAEHCQSVAFSSKMSDYLNHPAYRKLVELGPPAIPYIIEQYKEDEHLPWEFVLDEMTGLHKIDNISNFSPSKVKKRWLKWWEQTAEPKIESQRRVDKLILLAIKAKKVATK
jgi:hypothetical protein